MKNASPRSPNQINSIMTSEYIEAGGRRLAALFFVPDVFSHMVIICHGFRGAKENGGRIFSFAFRLNQMGLAVTAFDFWGSGASSGNFRDMTLSSQVRDLTMVIEEIEKRYKVPIILLGRSFGGSTVLAAGGREAAVAAMIFWSTPVLLEPTFKNVLAEAYERLLSGEQVSAHDDGGDFQIGPELVADFYEHNIDDYFEKVGRRPVLIVHGLEDQVVNVENAKILHQHMPNSTLEMVAGADHRFLECIEKREDITLNWIKRNVLQREAGE